MKQELANGVEPRGGQVVGKWWGGWQGVVKAGGRGGGRLGDGRGKEGPESSFCEICALWQLGASNQKRCIFLGQNGYPCLGAFKSL